MSHLSWNEQGCRAESEAVQGTVGRQGLLPGRRLRNEYRLQPQQGDVITSLACSLSLYLSLSLPLPLPCTRWATNNRFRSRPTCVRLHHTLVWLHSSSTMVQQRVVALAVMPDLLLGRFLARHRPSRNSGQVASAIGERYTCDNLALVQSLHIQADAHRIQRIVLIADSPSPLKGAPVVK